jgi:uncharacterized protein YggU (UPF0235/DUF167 family)
VQPRSGRTELRGRHGDALCIRVREPPVDGRATDAARTALAAALGVSASRVEIVAGERSRLKRFRIRALDADLAARLLAPHLGDPPA